MNENLQSPYYFMNDFKNVNSYDVNSIRRDFPILRQRVNGKPIIWLDNAATTQKPMNVINSINKYYSKYNSNVHRGAHTLAKIATNEYEKAREKVQKFIGASSPEEIVFVRGATEAINLVAKSYGELHLKAGDEILLTNMEHHSNIVPWQMIAKIKGAKIKVIPINDKGEIILEEYEKLLNPRTRIVAITHVSNVLGTENPVEFMIRSAHKYGACVLIDGAQAVPHLAANVTKLDADFYVFSGHKLYGPTGIGVLYGKRALLENLPPWQGGGSMIKDVDFDHTEYNSLPYKFEAGTGNIADAIGLGVAIDYLQSIGMDNINNHEKKLTNYAMNLISGIKGLKVIGTSLHKTSVISFVIEGFSPDSIAQYLDKAGIAIRAGHHCSQPTLKHYGVASCARASLGVYNTAEDIEALVETLKGIVLNY